MNICIVSTYSCTFEDFSAMVDEYEETFKEFITEYELVKVNDHKSIMMCHCTDMEAMGEMMSSPEMKEWDKENNCVDIVYSLEKINQLGQYSQFKSKVSFFSAQQSNPNKQVLYLVET